MRTAVHPKIVAIKHSKLPKIVKTQSPYNNPVSSPVITLQLKPEQCNAVDSLHKKDDVLAVLPTGYGKSLIFQLFAVAVSIEGEERQTVLVICPLKSIIEDQIAEAGSMGIPAASTEDISEDELRAAKCQLIFGSAETVMAIDR